MKTFQSSRKIQAQPEQIFAAFANQDQLAKWWGPNGFTNTFNLFEFTKGGKWSFVMHGPDGTDYPNESIFREIIPNELIVIRHDCQPYFTLSVRISPSGNGSLIEWQQEFDDETVAEQVAPIVAPANEQNLDRLTAVVKSK